MHSSNEIKAFKIKNMLKFIQLKLSKIKYSGDSIGDDIRVEVEALGKFLRVDKRIKVGATAEINREVGSFETDQKLLKLNTQIVVIEKDLLFNDVSQANLEIKIDTTTNERQQFFCKIEIKETRSIFGKIWGNKKALFETILEAEVSDAMRYVPNNNELNGWIRVRLEDDKSIKPLPAYLKVKFIKRDNKREYFTVLEGVYHGKLSSVALKEDGSSWLISDIERKPPVKASYSISRKVLTLNGKKYQTVDYRGSQWQKGLYDIEIPDYPHAGGSRYENDAPRAKTWFRIGHNGERYLHAGGRSLGCITVIELTKWHEIYDALINSRKNDLISVGVLEIVD